MFRRKRPPSYRIVVLVDQVSILDLDVETALSVQKFNSDGHDALTIAGGHYGIAINPASLIELRVRRI